MVIDYEALCDSLDISHEALLRGSNTYAREYVKLRRKYGKDYTKTDSFYLYEASE